MGRCASVFCSRHPYDRSSVQRPDRGVITKLRPGLPGISDKVTYFVTWRLGRGRRELEASERELVVAAMKSFDGQRYQLAAYVVMDDHVHARLAIPPFQSG